MGTPAECGVEDGDGVRGVEVRMGTDAFDTVVDGVEVVVRSVVALGVAVGLNGRGELNENVGRQTLLAVRPNSAGVNGER